LLSLEITPTNPSVAAGTGVQLTATGIYTDNSHADLTAQVSWSTSNAAVATIGAGTGKALGVAAGTATLSASLHGQMGTTTLTVTGATLTSIAITPPAPSIAAGTSEQLTATAIFSDNTTQNLTADLTWASSNTTIAMVSSSGLASALIPGSATISATCKTASMCGSLAGSLTLTVTPAILVSIAITPPAPSIALGTSEAFTATGTYSDNTTHDLTAQVAWISATPAVAIISNASGTAGMATSVITGTTFITAALGSVTSSAATLTVTAATLVSIAITPPAPSIALGTSETFTATGTYSDNSTHNLTSQVTWNSATPAVATISNASGVAGMATSVITGTTLITAALGSVTSSAVTLTVTAATLVSLVITPSAQSIALGTSETFTATGTYSDNSTHSLTAQVTWNSATPAVATISNASGTSGTATSVIVGTTLITAALGSATSPAVTLTVTPAMLVSLAITPPAPSIALGTSEAFTATGTYSDNSTQALTNQVTWNSATPAVATISNASGTAGTASAIVPGTTLITAALGSVTSSAVTLTVTPATLVSVAITPTGPSIPVAGTEQFTATGTYSDNSTQILTSTVTWASSDASIAPISNATGSQGLTTGLLVGSTSISAALGSVTSPTVTLTVTAQMESVLYSFAAGSDGGGPGAGLIQGTDGNFYGTTIVGGTSNNGTLFEVTPAGVETVLYSFAGGSDGANPYGGLIQGTDGNFYGMTYIGGTSGHGTVFMVTPTGIETVLYSFAGGNDGASPFAALIQGADGDFYGTTQYGGPSNAGTVFKVTPSGLETVLYAFTGGSDGSNPTVQLIQDTDGNLYGTTGYGGAFGSGTVFKVTPPGVETILYSFIGGNDGANPFVGLIQGADGNFYGTTYGGGTASAGTVFKITPGGVETVLYSFAGGNDGANPIAALVQSADGNFYGTTILGGASGVGTIFKITPTGVETVLYTFTGGNDGGNPTPGLIQGADGNFYGTTELGGTSNNGTVFKF
jgi:uncharacterized repeat protein (TIGR03803 family)